ncbi:MFS general substrate transporter [Zopfia rhizophila CBS 207.26]|uniref:MFS general substrate transporter n=1 Tax=Zopfia rhizophila CBS 207.26 TaxID=1314779 RepID=A0A6A6EMP8_9PEZI|nr:MFS general substrate transporter [Zopfia rhizophila CBS 207.26]
MASFQYAFSLQDGALHEANDELYLVPQPSSDPADPLNWSAWRKSATLACMSLLPWVANFTSSSISSALPVYASTPVFGLSPTPFSRLSHLITVNIIMLGASNLWWVPLANTFGRSPIVLASLLLLVFSSWAGRATSVKSLLAARFFMECGGGPADAAAPDVVGEIYFVHQRGRAMAIYTVFLATGSLGGSLCGGYIVAFHGLSWLHWTNVILSAITFGLCFLFQPETLYDRTTAHDSPTVVSSSSPKAGEKPRAITVEAVTSATTASTASYRPYTFTRALKLATYRPGIIQNSVAPFLTFRLPGVWLVSLWYAGLVGAIVTMSTIGPQLVSAPPYLWGKDAGLINVGGIIAESLSARGWVGLQFGVGMVAFGLVQAPSVGFNYLIESYPSISGDCFVAVTCVRAIVAFSWTLFVGHWVEDKGPAEPFGIFGMLMAIFGLLTIPVWMWGKRLRVATAKLVLEGVGM